MRVPYLPRASPATAAGAGCATVPRGAISMVYAFGKNPARAFRH